MTLDAVLRGKRVIVCAGAGGVGKTTTSAAVALGLASAGARVAVVTIDPARRLANALGLEELSNEPRRVDPERLAGLAVSGELWAMMLDPKRTFDELIERVAADPGRAAQIKSNAIYRELSSAVSGSQEFTAVSKIYDLARSGDYDIVVLDTPPARNALDFLDAPGRITAFLEGRGLRTFLRPTGLGMRVLGVGASPLLALVRRLTGVDLVGDLITFFSLLGDMTEDFTQRATEVRALLGSEDTAFLLVTSAQRGPVDEAIWFHDTLAEQGLPFGAAIVNRFTAPLLERREGPVTAADLPGLEQSTARKLAAALSSHEGLAARDARNVARLADALGDAPVIRVALLAGDVHDLAGLEQMRAQLFT